MLQLDLDRIITKIGIGEFLFIGFDDISYEFEQSLSKAMDSLILCSKEIATHPHLDPKRYLKLDIQSLTKKFDNIIINFLSILELELEAKNKLLDKLEQLCIKNLVLFNPYEKHLRHFERKEWENIFFQRGFRKHPRNYNLHEINHYNDVLNDLTFFEKINSEANLKYPIAKLLGTRHLHVDNLRESSYRSDAHIARYLLAADFIRSEDTVLDCACGLGYGSVIMSSFSKGEKYIAIDNDNDVIDYAKANFPNFPIDFRCASAENLNFIENNSIDIIVSFETVEHVKDYDLFFKEALRVLKPDGRIILSVPNLWVNEFGEDPNPYHFHVFDWDKIAQSVNKYFDIEERYGQTATGGTRTDLTERSFEKIEINDKTTDSEWLIIVATKNPIKYQNNKYTTSVKDYLINIPGISCGDYEQNYKNPWFYRTLVLLDDRLRNKELTREFISKVLEDATLQSVDAGAVLTVLAYQILTDGYFENYNEVMNTMQQYIELNENDMQNPHIIRWLISLSYVMGQIEFKLGNYNKTLQHLERITKYDYLKFSPLLATKMVAGEFTKALIFLKNKDKEKALISFKEGVTLANSALHHDYTQGVGTLDHPSFVGFGEIAQIAQMASLCAKGIRYIDKYDYSPGLFFSFFDLGSLGMTAFNAKIEKPEPIPTLIPEPEPEPSPDDIYTLYVLEHESVKRKINNFISCNKNKTICFYGAGKFAQKLLEYYDFSSLNLFGFLDNNSDKEGTLLGKYTIYHSEKLKELNVDILVISALEKRYILPFLEKYLRENNLNTRIVHDLFL